MEPDTDKEEEVVRYVLEQEDLDAERVLTVLMQTIVGRHLDIELRKSGKRPDFTPGNARANAIVAVMDAIHEYKSRIAENSEPRPGDPPRDPDTPAVLQALVWMIGASQFAGERRIGLNDDDDDQYDGPERPWIKLVRD